jgi:hypothetical protein
MRRVLRDYSLFWGMLLIFIVAIAIESVLDYRHLAHEYRWHGETLGMLDFWLSFARTLSGRVAASVLVLIIFTVARAKLIYRDSPVSKDGQEEMREILKRILHDVIWLAEERLADNQSHPDREIMASTWDINLAGAILVVLIVHMLIWGGYFAGNALERHHRRKRETERRARQELEELQRIMIMESHWTYPQKDADPDPTGPERDDG